MSVSFSLTGHTALVTGAARGNGRGISLGLAEFGAIVIATDIDLAAAGDTAREIRRGGGQALAFALDVGDREACVQLAGRPELEHVSVIVNNAGISQSSPIDAADAPDRWDRTFRTNVDGCYNTVRAFLPALRRTRGSVINIGSVLSFVADRHVAAYASSKGAVRQLTKALAVELAPEGIRVNGIAPGYIETAMTEKTRETPERMAAILAHTPMGRFGSPDEIVGAAIFLSSPAASFVTGAMIPVDGGYLAR